MWSNYFAITVFLLLSLKLSSGSSSKIEKRSLNSWPQWGKPFFTAKLNWTFSSGKIPPKTAKPIVRCESLKGECLSMSEYIEFCEHGGYIEDGFCDKKNDMCCEKNSINKKKIGPNPSTKFIQNPTTKFYGRNPGSQSAPTSIPSKELFSKATLSTFRP